MEIKTKLDFGDKIFFLHNNKCIESVVRGVKTESYPEETAITYLCSKEEPTPPKLYIKVEEKDAYKTKEALLKSL